MFKGYPHDFRHFHLKLGLWTSRGKSMNNPKFNHVQTYSNHIQSIFNPYSSHIQASFSLWKDHHLVFSHRLKVTPFTRLRSCKSSPKRSDLRSQPGWSKRCSTGEDRWFMVYKGNHPQPWPNYSGWWNIITYPDGEDKWFIKLIYSSLTYSKWWFSGSLC